MSATVLVQGALWAIIGLLSAVLHARLLQRDIVRMGDVDAAAARKHLLRGYALRLGIMVPILAVAAMTGLLACLAWLGGHGLGRTIIGLLRMRTCYRPFSQSPPAGGVMRETT